MVNRISDHMRQRVVQRSISDLSSSVSAPDLQFSFLAACSTQVCTSLGTLLKSLLTAPKCLHNRYLQALVITSI
jgi:hypothetical protein